MEIDLFTGAFLLLVEPSYGTLNSHFRNKRRDRMTDPILRDIRA